MKKQPNIIFFFTDQQRWDTCGCYGQALEITPNLDRMAAEGVRFEKAFTCQPVCGPARSCLQTGKYATETGCVINNISLPVTEKTIAHHFSEAGYETAYIGKWHLASDLIGGSEADYRIPVPPERRGGWNDFWLGSDMLEYTSHSYDGWMYDGDGRERHFPEGRYRADAQTDWAIEYLEKRKSDRPFILFLSYIEPHHQNDHHHYEGPQGSKEKFGDFVVPGDLQGTEGDWREEFPDYLGCCHNLDQNLGRIRAALEAQGLDENTLVIFTSDHGSHFRTRNDEYKRACHEGCIRVPLVACGPGFTGGRTLENLVSLIDLPPTLLRAAGIEVPDVMQGRPLQEALAGSPDWPEEVFVQISESQCGRAIRTERWKYAVAAPGVEGSAPAADRYAEAFLYDLERDPHEKNNLVNDSALMQVRAELRERLKRRMRQAGEPEPEIMPVQQGAV